MKTGDLIKAGRLRLGLNEQQFGDRIGVSRGAVQQWESGATFPRNKYHAAISDLLGISIADLLCLQPLRVIDADGNESLAHAYISDSDTIRIPQYDTGGKMGHGLILRDQPGIIRGWTVNQEWLQKNARSYSAATNLVIVTGFGDSMSPVFRPGDPLLVDTGVTLVDFDGIYFFRVGEEGVVKRLQRVPGEGMIVISENKAYRDWTIKPGMDFEVFGRVVKA